MLGGQTVILKFDVEVLASKDRLEPTRELKGLGIVVLKQCLQHDAPETARGSDDARGVALQQLPIQTGLVVVPLEKGQRGELS